MKDYRSTKRSPAHPFSIIACLREGYGPSGKLHKKAEADKEIERWTEERVRAGKYYLPGVVRGPYTYALGHGSGETGTTGRQPVIEFYGNASQYLDKVPDEVIIEILNDLAACLGRKLGQERIELSFNGTQWAIEL